jgi:ribosome biogenesis protein MAK21
MVDKSATSHAKRRRGRKGGDPEGSTRKFAKDNIDADPQSHRSLITLTDEEPTWYKFGQQQSERNDTVLTVPAKGSHKLTPALVAKYRRQADELYHKEVFVVNKGNVKSSDDRWMEGTMKKGTLKDRIAAMSVVVSTDPVHKLYALDGLLQMAGCSESGSLQTNSRVAQLAAEALEDLFLNTFLPPDRKLIILAQRPLYIYEQSVEDKKQTSKSLSPKILLLWRFEELVKEKFQLFLRKGLEKTLHDGLEMDKVFALRSASSLLCSVPEGETTLLQLIVNKLGDPAKKVAAAASHELRKVLANHPSMQLIMAREVQQLAFRPGLKSRALYHCVTFLNQLKLSRDKVAPSGTETGKSVSLPVSLISSYFRLFDVAVKKQLSQKDDEDESGMKSRLLSALLSGVNRAHPYLPEKDKNLDEHIDALYRVVHTAPPAASTQSLLLLFHVVIGSKIGGNTKPDEDETANVDTKRQDRFYRALFSALSSTHLVSSGKHLTMLFNLLYKAMKYDSDATRVVAFAKRVMGTSMHCSAPVVAASIYLLNEVSRNHPVLQSCFQDKLVDPDSRRSLDPTKRDPHAALAIEGVNEADNRLKKAPLWELGLTMYHFHPSVAKFSGTLGEIVYSGDPLRDFSLLPFLDKLAYRNPKSAEKVAESTKRVEGVGKRRSGKDSILQSHAAAPVNDPSFLRRQAVDVNEEFFHKFFVERSKRDELKGIVKSKKPSDDMDEEEEEEKALYGEETFDLGRSFDDFERNWETDSQEEAYVDGLAQQIIEDALDKHGPGELDDEDPDTDGWDDLHEDEDEDEDPDAEGAVDDDSARSDDGDDDDFMEDSDDDSDSDNEAPELLELEDEEHDDGSDGDGSGDGLASDSDEDPHFPDESDEEVVKTTKKRLKEVPTFADAEDYEEMISASLREGNSTSVSEKVDGLGNGGKRKKRRR